MRVAALFEMHRTCLAETEALASGDDEDANEEAFAELHRIEDTIVATPASSLASVAAKIGLALGYARENAPDGELEREWLLVESAYRDLGAFGSAPVKVAA